jgi:hypothetical protein
VAEKMGEELRAHKGGARFLRMGVKNLIFFFRRDNRYLFYFFSEGTIDIFFQEGHFKNYEEILIPLASPPHLDPSLPAHKQSATYALAN